MPTAEQDSWLGSTLGIDVGALAGVAKTIVQFPPGSAMLPDCKPVKGKVPGPAHHLLCETHGHVVDIKQKKIIATSLDEYKSKKLGSAAPAPAAAPAQGAASAPAAATTPAQGVPAGPGTTTAPGAPGQAAPNGAAPAGDTGAVKAGAEIKKVMALMKDELDSAIFFQKQHEELAGGGRLNRAVSWISDAVGGADDPGEELSGIISAMLMEQIAGVAAVGSLNVAGAYQHLDAMKAMGKKAERLFKEYTGDTEKGAGRMVTGLGVVSKAGDVATMGLNVVAPGAGKILSVVKNVSVTGSKLAFGEKVNWTEFGVDMAFDLFVGGEGGGLNKVAEKLAGPLAKKLAPKMAEALAKKWGLDAVAKKLGGKVTEAMIEKYIVTEAEEVIKSHTKDLVTPIAEHVVESAKDKDITNGQIVDMMIASMSNPSGQFADSMLQKMVADFKP
jgi:hypothetical protein